MDDGQEFAAQMPPAPFGMMGGGTMGTPDWTACPVTVRLEPMPFYVADWQVAQALRPCGELLSVRFQRNGDGVAFARFSHASGATAAVRYGQVNILGQRVFIQNSWCAGHSNIRRARLGVCASRARALS